MNRRMTLSLMIGLLLIRPMINRFKFIDCVVL